jgi:3-oxoacyl-[acyl-carrier-protein] synthase III
MFHRTHLNFFIQVDVVPPFERFIDCKTDYDAKMHRDDRKSVYMIGRSVHDEVCNNVTSMFHTIYFKALKVQDVSIFLCHIYNIILFSIS